MPKIKTLIPIISVFVFYLFYLNNIVYAGGVDVNVSPFPAFLKVDDDVTITARDVDRGITYTGYSHVCWRINELIIEDCVLFTDSDNLTTNLSKQSITDIKSGSYHYEVVLKRPNGGYDSAAGVEFTVGDDDSGNPAGTTLVSATITSSNPNPAKGEKIIFTGTYSASDIPTPPGADNASVCWAVNTQIQNVCVDAPGVIPNFEYTFPDALLYDISLEARNKLDDSFIKVLSNIGVTVTESVAGGSDDTSNGTVSGGTSSGNINGSGISLRFPNPLGGGTTTVIDVVRNIINGIFGLLGAIAVAMIVYGGIIYMTGGSSKDGVEKGKKIITSAVVGLVIVLLSLAIIDLLFVLLGGK